MTTGKIAGRRLVWSKRYLAKLSRTAPLSSPQSKLSWAKYSSTLWLTISALSRKISDAILREEIAKAGLDRDIWQYFTVNTGVRSVGVMGDGRTYDYTIAIRAITSIDGMTADFAKIPWEVLQKISVRIVNEVDHVNRIVYDITSKPPATVEWE